MVSYRIEWKASASRELRNLPREIIAQIVDGVTDLGDDPFPSGIKKLAGAHHTYRIHFGSYRVIYTVSRDNRIVAIIRVGHRQSVYKR